MVENGHERDATDRIRLLRLECRGISDGSAVQPSSTQKNRGRGSVVALVAFAGAEADDEAVVVAELGRPAELEVDQGLADPLFR
jgi:hypothetical protein